MTIMLAPNFSLAELVFSENAARLGIDNTPPPEALHNLKRLGPLLQDVRDLVNMRAPSGTRYIMSTSSGYRNPEVNRLAHGSSRSAHLSGRAWDGMSWSYGTPTDLAELIAGSSLPFDKVIEEYGHWVHIQIAKEGQTPRRMVLHAIRNAAGKTQYLHGLPG